MSASDPFRTFEPNFCQDLKRTDIECNYPSHAARHENRGIFSAAVCKGRERQMKIVALGRMLSALLFELVLSSCVSLFHDSLKGPAATKQTGSEAYSEGGKMAAVPAITGHLSRMSADCPMLTFVA
jgi:hypothetical protein